VQTLAYREQTKDEAEFVRMLYTVRLKKVNQSSPSPFFSVR
jgi:hypothetical protein